MQISQDMATIHHTLSDEVREKLRERLNAVSTADLPFYNKDSWDTLHPITRNTHTMELFRHIMESILPEDILNDIRRMKEKKGAPIVVLHNLPINDREYDMLEKSSQCPAISERVLQAMMALLADNNLVSPHPEAKLFQMFARGDDFYHIDLGSAYQNEESQKWQAKTDYPVSMLLCQKGLEQIETAFMPLGSGRYRKPVKKEDESVRLELTQGDLVLFDNTTLIHGRLDQNKSFGRRHLLGLFPEQSR